MSAPQVKSSGAMGVVGDAINHPTHYISHPSGIECIQITEHHNFNVGNAIKYLWRAGLKGAALEDLKKARWYIEREITRAAPVKTSGLSPDDRYEG